MELSVPIHEKYSKSENSKSCNTEIAHSWDSSSFLIWNEIHFKNIIAFATFSF